MTKWTKWSGAGCPVDPGTTVQVKLRRKGSPESVARPAGDWYWMTEDTDDDIVAYRVVKED